MIVKGTLKHLHSYSEAVVQGMVEKWNPVLGPPGPLEPLEPPGPWDPSTSGSHGLPEPPGPLDPRTPGDLRTSGPFGNYLYHLKFRT